MTSCSLLARPCQGPETRPAAAVAVPTAWGVPAGLQGRRDATMTGGCVLRDRERHLRAVLLLLHSLAHTQSRQEAMDGEQRAGSATAVQEAQGALTCGQHGARQAAPAVAALVARAVQEELVLCATCECAPRPDGTLQQQPAPAVATRQVRLRIGVACGRGGGCYCKGNGWDRWSRPPAGGSGCCCADPGRATQGTHSSTSRPAAGQGPQGPPGTAHRRPSGGPAGSTRSCRGS